MSKYSVLRIDQMPAVEVYFVQGGSAPLGLESRRCRRSHPPSATRSLPPRAGGSASFPSVRLTWNGP